MNCTNCGQPVPPGSNFCGNCAAPVLRPAALAGVVPPKLTQAAEHFVGRVWALERVDQWLRLGDERLFLLIGEPGCGKSLLSAWLCGAGPPPEAPGGAQALGRARSAWAAACFCMSRGQGGSVDAAWFVRSLVEQLSSRFPGYAEAVLAAVNGVVDSISITQDVGENRGSVIGLKVDNLKIGAVPDVLDRYALTVVEPLRVFAGSEPTARVVVLVDGADEALGQEPAIATLVARAANLPGTVRFFVTTRRDTRVLDALSTAFDGSVASLDLSSDAAQAANDADILAYVNKRASEVPAGAGLTPELAHRLVEQAAGNFLFIDFLMEELVSGRRSLEDLSSTPASLYELYRSYLDRVVPGTVGAGVNEQWLSRYQPLLGSISVAVPAAPQAPLRQWLRWDEAELYPFMQPVEQLTEWVEDDGGGWRLYHRSMGEFLATARYPDRISTTPRANLYYVSPPEQHDRIVNYSLAALDGQWGGDWAGCDDAYCLRNLVQHMRASLPALANTDARAERTARLYGLVLDPAFRSRQAEVLGGLGATVDDCRTALEVAQASGDRERAAQLIEALAAAPEADLRGLAVEWLVGLFRREPAGSVQAMETLLSSPSANAWGVALNAAFQVS